jgi:molecular chaperone DnaK (HSP70)
MSFDQAASKAAKYCVGIDLGTSNSVLSRVNLETGELDTIPVLQRISESEVRERPLLPSFLYLPGSHELPEGSLGLPWDKNRDFLVGEFARYQGSRVPGRVVVSAKSWLAHRQADPSEPLLPWDCMDDVSKISPVEASRRYLAHLREAWNYRSEQNQWVDGRLEDHDVVLTVPASFDELARELTLAAAQQAGIEHVTLQEEPQAAFYSWLYHHGRSIENPEGLEIGDQILVCDIGGGTTDFTLIENHSSGLRRIAVGEHLMLGGDNLDIAIAHLVEPRLGAKLDILQWGVLRNECRRAKEILLGAEPPEFVQVVVPGSGSKLLAGTLTADVQKSEVESMVLDGFFPMVTLDEPLQHSKRMGLREFGLPYANDPAIPRHLAAFLRRHRRDRLPNRVLFNGGACRPAAIRQRILSIVESWIPVGEATVTELENPESDLSVARGAAYFGYLRKTGQRRIGGGSARSYYLQLGAQGDEGVQAICVIPRQLEAGHRLELTEPVLQLLVERAVRFPLYSSAVRPEDQAGQLVTIPKAAPPGEEQEESEFQYLPAMETVVRAANLTGGVPAGGEIPVYLQSEVTEVGTLSIACQMVEGRRRFCLEFPLRGQAGLEAGAEFDQEVTEQAKEMVRESYRRKPGSEGVRPRGLLSALEQHFGLTRQNWSIALLRSVWETFHEMHPRRRADSDYESSWLNGVGYCLRPGTGSKLDPWRVEKTASVLENWLQFPKNDQVRMELWVAWRRIAAGLSADRQQELWRQLAAVIVPGRRHWKTRVPQQRPPSEDNELLRLAVSLERIPIEEKVHLAQALQKRFQGSKDDFWRIARVAGRIPFAGGVQNVIPPDQAWPLVEYLLSSRWQDSAAAGFCLSRVCKITGDRKRDFSEEQLQRVRNRLTKEKLTAALQALELSEASDEASGDALALIGEALPVGIRL